MSRLATLLATTRPAIVRGLTGPRGQVVKLRGANVDDTRFIVDLIAAEAKNGHFEGDFEHPLKTAAARGTTAWNCSRRWSLQLTEAEAEDSAERLRTRCWRLSQEVYARRFAPSVGMVMLLGGPITGACDPSWWLAATGPGLT